MNALVQALVWTTIAALMGVLWMHSQNTTRSRDLALTFHFSLVTNQLQAIWVALGLGLLISAFMFLLPSLHESAIAASMDCGPGQPPISRYPTEGQLETICGPIETRPESLVGEWQVGTRTFIVDAKTDIRSAQAAFVPGREIRAELIRTDPSHWSARYIELLPKQPRGLP